MDVHKVLSLCFIYGCLADAFLSLPSTFISKLAAKVNSTHDNSGEHQLHLMNKFFPMSELSKPTEGRKIPCYNNKFFAHPESCLHFFQCVDGNFMTEVCETPTHWNDTIKQCDIDNIYDCKYYPSRSTLLKSGLILTTYCVPGRRAYDPEDTRNYYLCHWYYYEKYQCDNDYVFDKRIEKCVALNQRGFPETVKNITILKNTIIVKNTSTLNNTATIKNTTGVNNTAIKLLTHPINKIKNMTVQIFEKLSIPKIDTFNDHLDRNQSLKVICTFSRLTFNSINFNRYIAENMNDSLCTHIVFDGAVLDESKLIIKVGGAVMHLNWKFHEKVAALQARGLKVLLTIGGRKDSGGIKYSRLVSSYSSRQKFIAHIKDFLKNHKIDGLNLNWQYPVCWRDNCNEGPKSDKKGFAILIKELHDAFKSERLLLSATISSQKATIDKAYSLPTLIKYLDWLTILGYNFHGSWEGKTGHLAPLYYEGYANDKVSNNINHVVNYLIYKGVPSNKIILGLPLFGMSFTMTDLSKGTGVNVPAVAGKPGKHTKTPGLLSYVEICDKIRNRNWNVVHDHSTHGPYAYKGNQWVSFDDLSMVVRKAQFIRDKNLGGGMLFALDFDDSNGECDQGKYPMARTFQYALINAPDRSKRFNFNLRPMFYKPNRKEQEDFKVVCYIRNWKSFHINGSFSFPQIDTNLCTHVVYPIATIDSDESSLELHDSLHGHDDELRKQIKNLNVRGVSVLLGIDEEICKYYKLLEFYTALTRFANNVNFLIESYDFDGLNLNLDYSTCQQDNGYNKSLVKIKDDYMLLVEELSVLFKEESYLLTAEVSSNKNIINEGYDVDALKKYFNWISISTHNNNEELDMWNYTYSELENLYSISNINNSIHYWTQKGLPAKKLVIGTPIYGRLFNRKGTNQHGTKQFQNGGYLKYNEICGKVLSDEWILEHVAEEIVGLFAHNGNQWIIFDREREIEAKAQLIKKLGLGGGMVWGAEFDDFEKVCGCESYPMLKTINRVLRNNTAIQKCNTID